MGLTKNGLRSTEKWTESFAQRMSYSGQDACKESAVSNEISHCSQ